MITQRAHTTLTDEEINALLDEHLFSRAPLCLGGYASDGNGVSRCQWCNAVDDRAVASRIFDEKPWHRRQASYYTPAEIVHKVEELPREAQIVFVKALSAQILGRAVQIEGSALTEVAQIIFSVERNVRAVGLAALMALHVVDE